MSNQQGLANLFFLLITKPVFWVLCLLMVVSCQDVKANPASTEYVQNAVNALRYELNIKMNQIPTSTQISTEINTTLEPIQRQLNQINQSIEQLQNQVKGLSPITYQIGDRVHGGIVFYVDESKQHGLVASLTDLNEGIEWRNGESGDRIVNAKSIGLGSGDINTKLIVAMQTSDQQDGEFAALAALTYQVTADGALCSAPPLLSTPCLGGWYLPSLVELMLMHNNLKKNNLGQLSDGLYWSSTEDDVSFAWSVNFSSGEPFSLAKSELAHVRAIHSF